MGGLDLPLHPKKKILGTNGGEGSFLRTWVYSVNRLSFLLEIVLII